MNGLVADKAVDDALGLIIDRLRQQTAAAEPSAQSRHAAPDRTQSLAGLARALYRERRNRPKFLGEGIDLGEPAWDILLDLYVADSEQRRVSISSACIAACVPPTTALRCISQLVERGAIRREPDACDRRRAYLMLEDHTNIALTEYLRALIQA